MANHYHYCPTCATKRPSISYRCTLCGTPVRLTERPVQSAKAA
jgi:DNA-directed RNA polymerase subunit RPC12/RpoP